jgi:hypothetical protein
MTHHDEQAPYPEALTRIEQALARIQIASDLAAQKIEVAAKAAAEDAVESATSIAVMIERVSTHIDRKDLHGISEQVSDSVEDLRMDMRAQRKWLLSVLVSTILALVALAGKVVADHLGRTP